MINQLKAIQIEDIKDRNSLGNFYPLSSKDSNSQIIFDSKAILGLIIGYISKQKIQKKFTLEIFRKSCKNSLESKLSDKKSIDIICKLYFDSKIYLTLSPLMYQIYQSNCKKDKSKVAFEMIFRPLLKDTNFDIGTSKNLNFIEKHILDSFYIHCEEDKKDSSSIENSYLEFLENSFRKDFLFLLETKDYFLENIDRFIKFYIFIYSSQLALNLKPYFLEKPISRELYFILNTEKTSQERKKLVNHSYKTLFDKVGYIFPYLSALEMLGNLSNKKNLRFYQLVHLIEDTQEYIKIIDSFTTKFQEKRKIEKTELNSKNIKEALTNLLDNAYQEFDKSNSKYTVFKKYKNAFEKQIAKDFIQSRGRFGKVCVLDQEMILFITNLSIGKDRDFLHFEELVKEFEERGVYFDHKSKEALLVLFERVENIERKSDSGDSIYVYKTV